MKKNLVWILVCMLIGGILAGCKKKEEATDTTNIFGLWQTQDVSITNLTHMRFLTESQEAKEGDCYFGKEWNKDDDVDEEYLTHKGNGWFKWKTDGSTLSKYKHMEYGWAEVPEIYTIKSLSSGQMVLQLSGEKETSTWTKK